MKINEIIDEGVTSLFTKGLEKLGRRLAGSGSAPAQQAAQQAASQAASPVVRPSNITKQQWKQMTPQQRQAVTGQPTPTAPAAPTSAPATSSKAAEIQTAKDKLELARLKAELDNVPGTASKIGGFVAKNPVTSAAIGTMGYHLAGEEDPLSAQGVGSAARKTVGTAANVVKGFVGSGDTSEPATAATDTPATGAETPQAAKPSADSSDEPSAQDQDSSDDSTTSDSGNYVDQIRQGQDERFGQWGKEANESVKKKIKLDEVDATQQAFMDAIKSAESGGRNIRNVAGSTAYGHYQFLQSTAERMARDPKNRNTPIYGKSWEEYKRDPKLQQEFMNVATKDYTDIFQKNQVPVTGGTLYMAHHFGPDMAVKMHNAGPKAKMADFYPEYVTKKNPKTGQSEKVLNPVYAKNPALKPNQSVQYTHDRLDTMLTKRDKTNTLASLDKKNLWTGTGTATVATAGTTATQGAKPADDEKPQTLAQKLEKILQPEPRFYKRGELSIDQYMKKSQEEVDRLRAAAQRVPGSQSTGVTPAPSAGTVITPDSTATTTAPASAGTIKNDPQAPADSDDDKMQNQKTAVAENRLQPNLKSVNKEIQDIIRLARFLK
jgi:hypothetical protein